MFPAMSNQAPGARPPTSARWVLAAWTPLAVAALLFILMAHAAAARRTPLRSIEYDRWVDGKRYSMSTWRYWEDAKFAIGRYLDWTRGPKPAPALDGTASDVEPTDSTPTALTDAYRQALIRSVQLHNVRHWQFWRTVPARPFLARRMPYSVPLLEDPGRGLLSAVGFRLLGGVAPFLPFWLAVIVAIPVSLWLFLELASARGRTAALVCLGGLAASPYVAEALTLPHSAVGFQLVALLAAAAFGVYAVLGRCRSPALFWARVIAAGCLGALCTLCRSGTMSFLPGLLLMVLIAVQRVFPSSRQTAPARWWSLGARAWVAAVAASVLIVTPYLMVKPQERHPVWLGLWEGLADFGESRGYSWHDRDAKRLMVAHGLEPFEHPNQVTATHEKFFRSLFLRDVAADPLWYAGVLLKRTLATATQFKLLPWAPLDGTPVFKPILHDKYTTPVDWVGVSTYRIFELPLPLLWIPAIVLLILSARAGDKRDWRTSAAGEVAVLALIAGCALPLPVLVTTAGGIETQMFALTYLVATAFLAQRLVGRGQRGAGPEHAGTQP